MGFHLLGMELPNLHAFIALTTDQVDETSPGQHAIDLLVDGKHPVNKIGIVVLVDDYNEPLSILQNIS